MSGGCAGRPYRGPPAVTPTRDVDAEVAGWRARLQARREQLRVEREAERAQPGPTTSPAGRRRWRPW
ncbi:hypothetical protein BH20ACT6_BH20ACT6_02730 [soil metagenome]